jgi:hypothetical protein
MTNGSYRVLPILIIKDVTAYYLKVDFINNFSTACPLKYLDSIFLSRLRLKSVTNKNLEMSCFKISRENVGRNTGDTQKA